MKPALLRLFIAIQVSAEVRTEMTRIQNELRPLAVPEDVRWVKPEQFHLTLKFLGNVPVQSLEAIKKSLAEACVGFSPFQLCAKGIGFFPNERSPRVIWIGIENAKTCLAGLQKQIAESLAPYVKELDMEKFHAHVTLGRFQKFRQHKAARLLPRALELREYIFGEWRVEQIDLMQSRLSSTGAIHLVLSSVTLT